MGLGTEQLIRKLLLLLHSYRPYFGDGLSEGVVRNPAHGVFSGYRAGIKGIRPFSKASCCKSMGVRRMSTIKPLTSSIHTMGLSASRLGKVHSSEKTPILR